MNWRFICIGFEIHSASRWALKYWFCGTLVSKLGNGTLQNYDTFLLCLFMADLVSVKVLLVQVYSRSSLTKTQGRSFLESLDIESYLKVPSFLDGINMKP